MNNVLFQTNIFKKIYLSQTKLTLILISLSLMLCAWIMHIQGGRINIDAVLYIESAKSIARGDWQQASSIYNWPFYSMCIAGVHLLSGLDFEVSAQLLNLCFFGITTASFLTIISLAKGGRLELIFGALILFSARHIVGVMLSMPMRDQGFWAFFLTAIVFFIRFVKFKKLSDALLWQVFIVIATLFRIEGIGYLVLLPIMVFCIPALAQKWRLWLASYLIPIIILAVLFLINTVTDNLLLGKMGRLNEILPSSILASLTGMLTSRSELMANQILGKYLGGHAIESLLISFMFIVSLQGIKIIGLINFSLVIKSIWHRHQHIGENEFKILIACCAISMLNLMFIVTSTFVLVGRYAAPIGFLLMILAAFSIRPIIGQRYKLINSTILIFLALFIAQNIYKNIKPELKEPFYMKQAIAWLDKKNTAHKPVLYDNMLSRFYANEPFLPEVINRLTYIQSQLSSSEVYRYEYILINSEDNKEQRIKEQLMKPLTACFDEIKRFYNQKNNKYVLVYQKNMASGNCSTGQTK